MKYKLLIFSLLIWSIGYSQVLDLPQVINLENQIIKHDGYILSYNESCEQANWVKYMITKNDLNNSNAKRKNKFIEDTLVNSGSASLDDYKGSGYDRGHLASSADFVHNQELNDQTFFMSNMSPQDPSFNRGIWKKLETYARSLAMTNDTVYVITGGILSGVTKHIGENKVCVPSYFYKIILDKNNKIISCYLMENKKLDGDLRDYNTPIKNIEKISGLKFVY